MNFGVVVIGSFIFTLPKIVEHISLIEDMEENLKACRAFFKISEFAELVQYKKLL